MGFTLAAVALLIALKRGALCETWTVSLPQNLVGVGGSCLVVPCSFSVPTDQEAKILNCSDSGVWRKGDLTGPVVLNSLNPFTNVVQGQVLGDLTKKNCTTIFHNFPKNHSDTYYLRLNCPDVKYTFTTGVGIVALEAPSPPQLTPVGVLTEGDPVRLQCSVPVPCSLRPPTLRWRPQDDSRQETTRMLQNADGQMTMTSTLTFIASADHHQQNLSCSVSYPLTKGGSSEASVKAQRLNVRYAPRFTVATLHTSGPVPEGRTVTFTCSSDAHPAVSRYSWYRDDGGNMIPMGEGETLVLPLNQGERGLYLCEAHTSRGSQRSRPVSLEISGAPGPTEVSFLHHYMVSGVMLVLYIITVTGIVFKYRSLSRRLRKVEQKEEDTYVRLKTSSCVTSSDYDQLQTRRPKTTPSSDSSDYENTAGNQQQRNWT